MAGLDTRTGQRNVRSPYVPRLETPIPNRNGNQNSSFYASDFGERERGRFGFARNNPYFDPGRPRDDWTSLDASRRRDREEAEYYSQLFNNVADNNVARQERLQNPRLRTNENISAYGALGQIGASQATAQGQIQSAQLDALTRQYLGRLGLQGQQLEYNLGTQRLQTEKDIARMNQAGQDFQTAVGLQGQLEANATQRQLAGMQASSQRNRDLMGLYGSILSGDFNYNYWS